MSNFYIAENGVTIKCPCAEIGESHTFTDGPYAGRTFTKRIRDQITPENAQSSCTSGIVDMSRLFEGSGFNGDISHWDVSSVKDMSWMFYDSKFNQPIGNWDVSGVELMRGMFSRSRFNQPIGCWNVPSVKDMFGMFTDSLFNQPIDIWDVSGVKNMGWMFVDSCFNHPISSWDISKVEEHDHFADNSTLERHPENLPGLLQSLNRGSPLICFAGF